MSGNNTNSGPGDDTMEMSGTQSSTIYSDSMCSDESSPLLMYTQTRNSTKKSSILYVDKAALYQMQQSQSGSRYVAARSSYPTAVSCNNAQLIASVLVASWFWARHVCTINV